MHGGLLNFFGLLRFCVWNKDVDIMGDRIRKQDLKTWKSEKEENHLIFKNTI